MKLEEIRAAYEAGTITTRINLEHGLFFKLLAIAEIADDYVNVKYTNILEPIYPRLKKAIQALEAE